MAQEKIQIKKDLFQNPEEEIAYLREQVTKREALLEQQKEDIDRDKTIDSEIKTYTQQQPEEVLTSEYQLPQKDIENITLDLEPEEHDGKMEELLGLMKENGIRNTLSVVEKMNNPHIEDDFHRFLTQYIKADLEALQIKEQEPLWKSLNMTLYEIAISDAKKDDAEQKSLKEILSSMEQFYAGMLSVSDIPNKIKNYFTLEIAVSDNSDDIVLYASVPNHKKDLFEKQILSIFHDAKIHEQRNDYNIFVEDGVSLASSASLTNKAIFPIKTYEQFDHDPFNIILNAFSKIEKQGGGASLQFVFSPVGDEHIHKYKNALKQLKKGVSTKEALDIRNTLGGEFVKTTKGILGGALFSSKKDKQETSPSLDQTLIENIEHKISSPILSVNIRVAVSAKTEERASDILSDIESAFNQFENTQGNNLKFKRLQGNFLKTLLREFSFRTFSAKQILPLNIQELTTLMHIPAHSALFSPQFKKSKAGSAPAPMDVSQEGTLLGVNTFRNNETNIYLTKEDRMRHMYVIGQTGTGKTAFLKNMIIQDIEQGEGVCMIDPHGTDIVDVLGAIPPERHKDVIYFDPAYVDRSFALNMLEYDPAYPEQKTFVVNELFSIFQKLYGAIPESMGPMFEQYFRNATMLVLEDPSSGSTLLDVSRVLVDESFRNLKLSRCNNPVVSQFWKEIATKAGGEQSLANIVPYITSKFDVFTANDYMRPLIAQEKSSFNFREIMDERKILLVNLSKGRLGDINANLIGLVLVGKILMAALSRVDSVGKDIVPFYLYIDEFQNITTDSIATILSEARKYKLSLTIAHQFIAQLEDGIRDAVFGNVGSIASFRVGTEDAEFLEKQFSPVFSAHDLINIDNYNAYARLLINGRPTKPFNFSTIPPAITSSENIETLKKLSYERYGRPRDEIEADIKARYRM